MRTRTTALAAGAAIAALALAGCSSGSGDPASSAPADQATTAAATLSGSLEFMTGTSIDSELYVAYEDLTKAFESANPDVTIELVPSSTDHEGEVKTRLASGNIPDMWMTHGWSLLRYSDFLMPLTDEAWAKDVNPALDAAMRDAGGAIYALPLDVDVAGLLYNADVLDSVGVKPEDLKTWDDFTAACDKIKAAGKTAIYTAGKDRWPTGLFVDWIAPGAYDEAALATQFDGTLVPEDYQVALDKVAQFRDAGYFNPDYSSATSDDISLALAQGDTGFSFLMNFVAVTAYTYNPDAKVGFMPIPSASGGDPYLVVGEKNAIGISKTTESPDAAKAYLAFLAQPENESALAKAAGSAPGLTTATSDLGALQASYDQWVGKAPSVPYFDRVYMPNGAWDTIVSTTEGVLTNQMSVSDAMAKLSADFDSLTAQAKS